MAAAECIAAAPTCDDARECIMGPHPWAMLPVCEEGVMTWLALDHLAPIARDTDAYRPPEAAVREHVSAAIAAVARLDAPTLTLEAVRAGYVACRGADDEADLVLLRPVAPSSGHATIVIRALGAPRDVILGAPHPLWDVGTAEESATIFARIGARAVVVSGTHRCGSTRASGCDGVADACGTDAPVRESDMAHAVDSVFHAAHVALASAYADAWFVSVHGFSGPGISVSNGTDDPVSVDARVTRLAVALSTRFDDVTTCNVSGAPGTDPFERLCGTTNVQGRHLNGVAMACTDAATSANDRFAHLEQDRAIRDARADDVADAIAEAFDAM